MGLNIKGPKDIAGLQKMTAVPNGSYVRIENNIFSIDGKWLLKKGKDNKLESISSTVQIQDRNSTLEREVRRTIEDFGEKMDVDTKKLLYMKREYPASRKKPCITLSYMSILETGNPVDIEKWKKYGFKWYDIGSISRTQLTPNTSYTYGVIRQNAQEIQNFLKKYKEFDEKKFDQYFLHGMENREKLLEGIMYYTNKDLNCKYADFHVDGKFLTKEENIEELKKRMIRNCEQLYRFIYVLDEEDDRFDYRLRPEEKEKVNQMVEDTIQRVKKRYMLMFSGMGIFFQDKPSKDIEKKGKKPFDLAEHKWTGEVYKIIQQLGFIERADCYQYYERWLQAKIGRLQQSDKKSQYPENKISELEEVYKNFFDSRSGQRSAEK